MLNNVKIQCIIHWYSMFHVKHCFSRFLQCCHAPSYLVGVEKSACMHARAHARGRTQARLCMRQLQNKFGSSTLLCVYLHPKSQKQQNHENQRKRPLVGHRA